MEDDQQLMQRLKHSDENALALLIARHRPAAEQYAAELLHDHALAEDVVQEAFARVYLHRMAYQPTFTFRTWLMVLVRRLCIDQLRRQKRMPLLLERIPDIPTASAEEACLIRLERESLMEALARLDARDRALLVGFAMDGLSCKELAEKLHMSSAQVRVQLHRLRKRLRDRERDMP